jgi:O-Antigen ligase
MSGFSKGGAHEDASKTAEDISPTADTGGDGADQSWDPKRPFGWDLPNSRSSAPQKEHSRRWRKKRPGLPVEKPLPPAARDVRPASPTPAARVQETTVSSLERLAAVFSIVYIYLRFSFVHEYLAGRAGANLYLVTVVGALAYTGLLRNSTWRAASKSKLFWFWLIFCALLLIGLPLSFWPGGSYAITIPFIKDNFLCIPLIAGLFGSWRLLRRLIVTVAFAGVTVTVLTLVWHGDVSGRLIASWTASIGNPNDVAGHLLFVLPFILFTGLSKNTNALLKIVFLGSVPFVLYLVLLTGSRGAFIGIAGCLLYTFATGSTKVRMGFLISIPVLAAVLLTVVPASTFDRLLTFSNAEERHNEAVDSYQARRQLLVNSISATLHHPFLGVGSGQFSSFEGGKAIEEGRPHSNWQETHNSYTEVSSEDGIPALICMICGIAGTFIVFVKTQKAVKNDSALADIRLAAYFLSMAIAGFCVCIFFLNFAYKPYLVVLAGLAIAMQRATSLAQAADKSHQSSELPQPVLTR